MAKLEGVETPLFNAVPIAWCIEGYFTKSFEV